ncbi:MAG TPA: hypothetical protein PKG77_03985 [Phycisphaerae bacterium]|nr:hypothetical protein [Phycisphaerae bacterium]HQL72394.1 hypothetical protein [Phycisphaerae bacterium]
MNKGLFVAAVFCALLPAAGCSVQTPPPPQVQLPPPPIEGATTTAQMASVQRIMNTPTSASAMSEASASPVAAGQAGYEPPPNVVGGEDAAGRGPAVHLPPAPPARTAPPKVTPPARTAAVSPPKPVPPAKPAAPAPTKVVHGTLITRAGAAARGLIVVDEDGKSKGKATYAVTGSTYFEKVVDGGRYGKDLRTRGAWTDLVPGRRVWVRFSGGARPTVVAVATYIFPNSKAEYERYRKLFAR